MTQHPAHVPPPAAVGYVSTRGTGAPPIDFRSATLSGLAPDGGLYLPTTWPRLTPQIIGTLATASYVDTAVTVLAPLVGDSLSPEDLRALCTRAYAGFAHDAVTPLVQLDSRHWLMELHHGPTLAFKDVALQWLGEVFGHFLAGETRPLLILGATSGDTGSAAIAALAGQPGVQLVMLHPKGRVSEVQRRQMTTVRAPNIHNIAIEGSFDDAQAMVKQLLGDADLAATHRLSAVNSINWARIAAQVVYYFYAAARLGRPERPVAFSVPTGNFGDVFAGYVAAQMGAPIARLVVATNVNDILYRAFETGRYARATLEPTEAPSMDIQVSSNFERLIFDLGGRDGRATGALMTEFSTQGAIDLPPLMRDRAKALFAAERIDAQAMHRTTSWADAHCGQLLDPHTAIGLAAARAQAATLPEALPIITLATAHAAKFRDTVERATGRRPSLPARVGDLFSRSEHYETLAADALALKAWIANRLDQPQ